MSPASKLIAFAVLLACCGCVGATGPVENPFQPAATISIDSVASLSGLTATLPLRMAVNNAGTDPLDSIASFDFKFSYHDSGLSFLGATVGPAASKWEYFTWRFLTLKSPPPPAPQISGVRVLAIRDMANNRSPDSSQKVPDGVLFTLRFLVSSDRNLIGTTQLVQFGIEDCTDDALTSAAGQSILYVAKSIDGLNPYPAMYDTGNCARKFNLKPVLNLESGAVYIKPPKPDSGDVHIPGVSAGWPLPRQDGAERPKERT